jgi:hypothetical protein
MPFPPYVRWIIVLVTLYAGILGLVFKRIASFNRMTRSVVSVTGIQAQFIGVIYLVGDGIAMWNFLYGLLVLVVGAVISGFLATNEDP